MTLSFDNPPSLLRYDDGNRQLTLQPARVEDAPELVEAIHESLPELRPFMPWAHLPQTVEVQSERLAALQEGLGSGGDIILHLRGTADGPLLGCIGLHNSRMLNPLGFEVGYWMRSTAAGRGIMTLATQCVVVLGFEYFGAQRLQCGYNEANVASRRLSDKVGFHPEARLRNFEAQPTPEQRANGAKTQPIMVMTALFPDDRERLDWYAGVHAALTVVDPNGSSL